MVEHAENGRDGLFMAASETFDAVVLDRMLPGGIDGLRLLETLRSQKNTVPVLILSALAEVDERVQRAQGRRRRLSDEAVRLRRTAGAGRGAGAARQGRGAGDQARGRGPGARSAVAQVQRAARRSTCSRANSVCSNT